MAGLIFMLDLDGTLVDSEPLKGMALADTCSLYSHPVDSNIYAEVMGRDWDTVLSHFFEQAGINPDRDEFTGKFRHRYLELLDTRRWRRGKCHAVRCLRWHQAYSCC